MILPARSQIIEPVTRNKTRIKLQNSSLFGKKFTTAEKTTLDQVKEICSRGQSIHSRSELKTWKLENEQKYDKVMQKNAPCDFYTILQYISRLILLIKVKVLQYSGV